MSLAIINQNNLDTNTNNNDSSVVVDTNRRQVIKRKVLAIGKMSRNYTVLKENTQLVQQLKSLSSNGKLPMGILSTGEQGIREAIIQNSMNNNADIKLQRELKDYNSYQHQPTPNYKILSREGHI